MKITVPVPKEVLLSGLRYKYYIDAEESHFEFLPSQYGSFQNRRLQISKDLLNETGN